MLLRLQEGDYYQLLHNSNHHTGIRLIVMILALILISETCLDHAIGAGVKICCQTVFERSIIAAGGADPSSHTDLESPELVASSPQ